MAAAERSGGGGPGRRFFSDEELDRILSGRASARRGGETRAAAAPRSPAPPSPPAGVAELKGRILERLGALREEARGGEQDREARAQYEARLGEMKNSLLQLAELREKYPLAVSQLDQARRERDDAREGLRRAEGRLAEAEASNTVLRREAAELRRSLDEIRKALE